MPTIFLLFIFALLGLILIAFTGKFFFFVLKLENYNNLNFYSRFFFDLVAGLIIITVLKSIITSSFQTINVLFLLLPIEFFLLKIINKENINFFKQKIILNKTILIKYFYLLILFCIICGINILFLYSFDGSFKLPDEDLFFYSRLSNSLDLFGYENLLSSYNQVIEANKNGIILYHFFDLWLNTFFFNLFNLSSYFSLYFVTYPILIFIFLSGVIGIWEKINNKINFIKILISLLFLLVFGFYFEFYKYFRYMKNTIPLLTDTMPFTYYGRKLIIVGIFSFITLNLFWDKKNYQAIKFLLLTTAVYTSGTFLGLLGSFSFLLFISLIFNKKLKCTGIQYKTLIFIVVYILSFFLFTYFNRIVGFSDSFLNKSILNFNDFNNFLQNLKSAVAVIFYYLLFFIFCYSIYFIILFLNFKDTKKYFKNIFLYIFIIFVALIIGMFFLFIFYKGLNARQFFTNIFPFVNSFFILFFIILYEKVLKNNLKSLKNILTVILIFTGIIFNLVNSFNSQKYYEKVEEKYSIFFLKNVNKELSNYNKKTKIAYRFDLEQNEPYNRHLFSNFAFLDLFGYTNFINNSKIDLSLINNKLLYSNCEVCEYIKKTNDTLNYQFNFLRDNNIKFIVADDTIKIPDKYIKEYFFDPKSKDHLYVLKF